MNCENIIENIVSIDRNCKDAIFNNKVDKSHTYLFCFCDMPTSIPLTNTDTLTSDHNQTQDESNKKINSLTQMLLNQTIDKINYLTGNGKFDCKI